MDDPTFFQIINSTALIAASGQSFDLMVIAHDR